MRLEPVFGKLVSHFQEHTQVKDKIIGDLEVKRVAMEKSHTEVQGLLQGEWKKHIDTQIDAASKMAGNHESRLQQTEVMIQQLSSSAGTSGSSSSGGRDSVNKAGKWKQRGCFRFSSTSQRGGRRRSLAL